MKIEQLIREKISSLSAGQKKVAEYILQHLDSFSYSTLAKLSKEISVSETTIIRLAYSLGFESFSEMQRTVQNDILSVPTVIKDDSLLDSGNFYQNIIANELGVNFRITSGPAIERPGDLAALLTNLEEHDVLFIDEIHRLSRSVEEILYPSMEDFAIDIITGKGQMAASYHLPLPKFTLVGATTRAGQLTAPLRDRFGVVLRLELYTPEELAQIVERSAGILGIKIEHDGALEIASRSRGTPRIANRLLKRVRDFAQVMSNGVITLETARTALDRLEIDELGLDRNDRRMLEAIVRFYNGGPVGLETLAAAIGEEAVTIEDVYEPYLLQIGFVSRTPRGRCITAEACKHLGCEFPKGVVNAQPTQPTLFGDRES